MNTIVHSAQDRTPYTYLIGWSWLDIWYYGVRYAKGCHPDDLWTKYFTSSEYVDVQRWLYGEPDIMKIRKIFSSKNLAQKWESKVIRRMLIDKDQRFLNKHGPNGHFYGTDEISESTREKLRNFSNRRVEGGTHPFLGGKVQRDRVKDGTHHLLGGEIQRRNALSRVEDGTNPFLGPDLNKKRIVDGTHNFLGGEQVRKRVENGIHHWLGPETNKKRIVDGTHNFLGGNMLTALDIETGIISRISKELYNTRRDIYFLPMSKVFKEWKKKRVHDLSLDSTLKINIDETYPHEEK